MEQLGTMQVADSTNEGAFVAKVILALTLWTKESRVKVERQVFAEIIQHIY